jgi:hypothetical protein
VVPNVPDATTTASGSCASGWAMCAPDVGGLCCPSGWTCGSLSCASAGLSATVAVGKGGLVGNGEGCLRGGGKGVLMGVMGFAVILLWQF